MPLNLTTAAGVLKEVYLPSVRKQLNDETSPVYAQLEGSAEKIDFEGLEVVGSAHVGRSAATGSRGEYEDLPTADNQKRVKFRTGLKYHYGRMEFTGQVMRRAATDKGAFVNAVSDEMDSLLTDLKQDQNRQIFNDASASLAVATSVSGQVVTLTSPSPAQMRSFVIGMKVDIGTLANPVAGADNVTVSAVSFSAGTITLVGTVSGVTSGHFVRKADNFGNEITGLNSIIATGDALHSIDGAVYPAWNAYVNTAGALRAPTEVLLERAIDEISISGNGTPDLVAAPHDVVRNYAAQLTSQKRFADTELKGGYTGLTVSSGASGTCALVADRFATANTMFFINTGHLAWNTASDWEWMEEDGAVFNRVPNKDAYEATLFQYSELTTSRRNAHGKINQLQGA